MSSSTTSSPVLDAELESVDPQRRGLNLFRIFGIQIRLDYSWFFIFFLLLWSFSAGYLPSLHPGESTGYYWITGLGAVLLFFASLLLHELAHSFVAKAYGMDVPAITLFLFGGVSELRQDPDKPAREFQVAIVGPLMSFALAGIFWGIHAAMPEGAAPLALTAVAYLAWINLALGVFNLLPGYPLDGGRVLRSILWWRTGSLARATRVAADVGKALAVGIMILGGIEIFMGTLIGGLWLVFIGMFLRSGAEASYQNLIVRRVLDGCTVQQVMNRDPVTVSPDTSLRELVEDYILARGYRGFPVVEGDRVRGLITLTQIKDVPREKRDEITVGDHTLPLDASIVVSKDVSLSEALQKLSQNPARRLLVMDGDRLEGMISKESLVRLVEVRRVLDDQ